MITLDSRNTGSPKPFLAMEVLEQAQLMERSGSEVTYMCVGEPDLPVHPAIQEACIKAVREGKTKYTNSLGITELRESISDFYKKKYGVHISPERIIVSSGTSPLMLLIFSVLTRTKKKIILTNPCYACYPTFVEFTGGHVVYYPLSEEGASYEGVSKKIDSETAAIVINSPSNPTGEVIKKEDLKRFSRLNVPIISDEIYHGLNYECEDETMLSYRDDAIVINGFSKAFSMTGWRLGFAIVPEKYMRDLRSLHQNFIICAPNFVQWAGIVAIEHAEEIQENMRSIFSKRRKILLDGLRSMGLKYWGNPAGAFYVLTDFRFKKRDSLTMAMDILKNYGVAVTPGVDFGVAAEGFLRLSYATNEKNINIALEKLENYVKEG